jgi:hypothetical protein
MLLILVANVLRDSSRYCVGARILIPSLKLRLPIHLYDLHITIQSEVPRTWTLVVKFSGFWFSCLVILNRKLYRHVQQLLYTLCHPLSYMCWDLSFEFRQCLIMLIKLARICKMLVRLQSDCFHEAGVVWHYCYDLITVTKCWLFC